MIDFLNTILFAKPRMIPAAEQRQVDPAARDRDCTKRRTDQIFTCLMNHVACHAAMASAVCQNSAIQYALTREGAEMRQSAIKPGSEVFRASAEFEQAIATQGEAAAREHLDKGRPVYYADPKYPGFIVKKNPDGSEELARVDLDGTITVVRAI